MNSPLEPEYLALDKTDFPISTGLDYSWLGKPVKKMYLVQIVQIKRGDGVVGTALVMMTRKELVMAVKAGKKGTNADPRFAFGTVVGAAYELPTAVNLLDLIGDTT